MWGIESWGSMIWGVAGNPVPFTTPLGWMALGSLLTITAWVTLRRRGPVAATCISVLAIAVPLAAWAGDVSIPNTFANGTIADADQVNANFSSVETAVDDNDVRLDQLGALFGQNTSSANAGIGDQCTLGEVWLTAGFVASGLPAQGQLLPIEQNAALFSLMGTMYGGDGVSTFALPDPRDAAPSGLTYVICYQGVYPSPL